MISLKSSNSKRLWLDVMTLIAAILRLIQFIGVDDMISA